MKKTQKRLLGAVGLVLVAGMTIIAAQLPGSDASAVAENSITDTLKVRVVGDKAEVAFTTPASNLETYIAKQTVAWQYEHSDLVQVTMNHTDLEGNETSYNLWSAEPDFYPGDHSMELDLLRYGYGTFVLEISGRDAGGATTTRSSVSITFLAPNTDTDINENGDVWVGFEYDESTVDTITTKVFEGSNPSDSDTPVWEKSFPTGTDGTWIPGSTFEEGKTYSIVTYYYDEDGNLINRVVVVYKVPVTPHTGAPDTGGLFQNLNISKEDYLVTGLLIFFVFAIVGFGIVFRNHKSRATSSKRRK